MHKDRVALYQELEAKRESRVLVYVTGDRPQLETQISSEVMDFFTHHLDLMGDVNKISLVLHTLGGNTSAAWSIANLIRSFCKQFEVIVPVKALSAGTLISLGADAIVMTKQASLGPIDPSVHGPLNPPIAGANPNARFPVSVEAINGYLEFARDAMGEQADLSALLVNLSNQIHPLVLGDAYRARSQIRMLAKKLLAKQVTDDSQVEKILEFLCSESGSHDYTINRKEAREALGLNIEKPDQALYKLIRAIYDDISTEMELRVPYDPNRILGGNPQMPYVFCRAIIESPAGGSHRFVSEGLLTKIPSQQFQQVGMLPPGMIAQEVINDNRSFEGWKHEA